MGDKTMPDDSRTGRRRHPVVDAFLNTSEPMIGILRGADDGSDPVVHAMRCLVEARRLEFPSNEALDLAAGVFPPPEGTDTLFYAMFLSDWSLEAKHPNEREGLAIGRLARALVNEDETPPEVYAYCLRVTKQYLSKGDRVGSWQRVLARTSRDSPRCQDIAANYLASLATVGRLSEAQEELSLISGSELHSQPSRFVNAVETGRIDEAQSLLDSALRLCLPWNRQMLTARTLVLRVMLGDRFSDRTGFPDCPLGSGPVCYPAALSSLIANRPGQAMVWAREEEKRAPGLHTARPTIQAQVLLRSELAMGNAEAARRILEARIARTCDHYMDDLFRARIALLEGERAAAAGYFALVRENCRRYRAEGRLDFELRMACELSPADVLEMIRESAAGTAAVAPGRPAAATGSGSSVEPRVGRAILVGPSEALAAVRKAISTLAAHDAPVLITGETGTGKELAARAIHEASPRRDESFTAVNCAAISESLLASELFGHAKGAFTGAHRAMPGLFREAGRGTIFLDEIGELTPRMQAALLRALETGEIRPVGASGTTKVGCRVVTATNAPLEEMVAKDAFRKDLYYRLRRLAVHIPPLRERTADVVPLALRFLSEGRKPGRQVTLSAALEAELVRRSWPGNVRELRNEMERMRLLNSDRLDYGLPELLSSTPDSPGPKPAAHGDGKTGQGREGVRASGVPAGAEALQPPANHLAQEEVILGSSRTPVRVRQRLRELFLRHRELGTSDVCSILGVSKPTAIRYLKALCGEGLIEKVRPSGSPRTHYYRLAGRG
jgi:DNA-binding NtrC family response regulator